MLALFVVWIEIAGMLAGAKMSLSVVPWLGFVAVLCSWPRFEAWLVADVGSDFGKVSAADDGVLRTAA